MRLAPAHLPGTALQTILPNVPVGTRADLAIGGTRASIVKIDEAAAQDPARLRTLVDAAANYGTGVKLLKDAGDIAKEASIIYTAVRPGQDLGVGVECFAVMSATAEFAQAVQKKKGLLRITLAGAELGTTTVLVVYKSRWTVAVAAAISLLNKFIKAFDKEDDEAAPNKPAPVNSDKIIATPSYPDALNKSFIPQRSESVNAALAGSTLLQPDLDWRTLRRPFLGSILSQPMPKHGLSLGLLAPAAGIQPAVEWNIHSAGMAKFAAIRSPEQSHMLGESISGTHPSVAPSVIPEVGEIDQPSQHQ